MIRNGAMTQQSCEHRDAHDVFFQSGFFVKQQQTQCQTPHTHLRADQPGRRVPDNSRCPPSDRIERGETHTDGVEGMRHTATL